MSVEELEERIAKISTDIELQKAVLRKLEHSKILVQRQLNSVRDPVARLPLEISSEIFIQCLPPLPVPPGARHVPMLLLNICNAWSDIALSTPALWAGILLRFPYTEGFREFVGTWLGRARNHPLSVSLSSSFRGGVDPVIWQYGQQLKHLEVCYEKEDDEDSDTDSDILGFTSPVPLPLLETLTIRGSLESPPYRIFRIVKLLHLTPNLVECVFNCTRLVDSVDDIHPTLVLPNLRQLMVGNADSPHSDDGILKHLTLPQLESLSVGMYEVSVGDILSFLERSSPPLRKLVMGDAFDDLNLLDDCLRRVPTLMCLGLCGQRAIHWNTYSPHWRSHPPIYCPTCAVSPSPSICMPLLLILV
ncbi:hypothetical protein B0H11DRAFT_1873461 [Mycena galericulata]|nr:hypothetical protein B0H11DRAFT_1873461 [Mycena galericulata]